MHNIEIVLKKDSQGNEIDLNSMSLETSKAVRQILNSLIAIVEHEKDLNLKIGIEKGSVAERIIGNEPNLKVVFKKIIKASEPTSKRDNFYVKHLNILYDNFQKVEEYEMFYNSEGSKRDLRPLFSNKFKKSRTRKKVENNFNIEFISGVLEQNGGKKPNFHLVNKTEPITIQCDIQQAQNVNKFLYKEIKVSAWAKATSRGMTYQYCDLYVDNSEKYFYEFSEFFKNLKNQEGTEPFHSISEKLEEFYNSKDYAGARKFIRIFLNEFSIPIYLRTILVISKAFKNDEYFKTTLEKVESLLSEKIGKVY
jgi:hypothetical protein